MKKFLLLMLLGVMAAGCVDENYDLSKVDTDNVAIGDDKSEFRMPLIVVHVDKAGLKSKNNDIEALCAEADIWLPSTLPSGAVSVDLQQLLADVAYLDTLIDALIAEMGTSEQKLNDVATLVYNQYKSYITIPGAESVSLAEYVPLFREAFNNTATSAMVKAEVERLAADYLRTLDVEQLEYDIESIDLGDEVIDMLADNIDPAAKPGDPNSLCIYGTVESTLPVEVELEARLLPTEVVLDVDVMKGTSNIPETLVSAEDLRALVGGITIEVPVTLKKYYPGVGFVDGDQLRFNLSLVKRGGLKLNL